MTSEGAVFDYDKIDAGDFEVFLRNTISLVKLLDAHNEGVFKRGMAGKLHAAGGKPNPSEFAVLGHPSSNEQRKSARLKPGSKTEWIPCPVTLLVRSFVIMFSVGNVYSNDLYNVFSVDSSFPYYFS